MGSYEAAYRLAETDPEYFWLSAARGISWDVFPKHALDSSQAPLYRWFPDGELNTCFNAVDRHVLAGHGDRDAIIYDSPVTNTKRRVSYSELQDDVSRFAGVLSALGVSKGDRVVIYMPMIPEAVVAMLATARLGAVHSVVFGGFAPAELAARIDDAAPKVIVAASCGIEPSRTIAYKPLVDEAIASSQHKPFATVVFQRPELTAELHDGDHDWLTLMKDAHPHECVSVHATDPLYILYTSGTTGKPKGVVRDNGGHAVAMQWSLGNVYDIGPGEVFWAASDVGWVVGHSYIVYAPLIAGATTVMYEGKPVGTPDAGAFWRMIEEYKVNALFCAPTAIRAIKREDHEGAFITKYDLSSLKALFQAGERLDPDTYYWATEHLKVPVIDNWWQTETGWPIAANLRGLEPMPIKAGSPTVAVPGFNVHVVDGEGNQVDAGVEGSIVIMLPMPPGTLPTLWGDDQRYIDSYLTTFDGYYTTGDGGMIDEDGYVFVLGRTDDVINVAGHRLSTGSMEAVVASHPLVAECAVIGVQDQLKGQIPRAFVVLKAGADIDPSVLEQEIVQSIRHEIGAVAALKEVVVVQALPKTRSGKILRRTMRAIADGRPESVPGTIEDVRVLDAITPLLKSVKTDER
ncbi:MAG: propionyl-CoA synthetase [Candidatus Nanopelagicales bacterium]|nr:propionyl-CoA synthetase [Candidatus Nanopelagicales bacterium]